MAIILGIIFLAIGELLLLFAKNPTVWKKIVILIFLLLGGTFISYHGMSGVIIYNSSDYKLETEIRQELLNGEVVKNDTIYILIKK
jgi:hypothetical protein